MQQTAFRRWTFDKVETASEHIGNLLLANYRRKQLNNTDFTIIANNCWGGSVYRRYNISYLSPTVGLYFFADDYIQLINDLPNNLFLPLTMINACESKYAEQLRLKNQLHIPVGVLGDAIEVVFLHYKTPQEAYDKWNRRLERVNLNNIILKFSEMNLCQEHHLKSFQDIDYRKKLLLLAKHHSGINSGIIVNHYTKNGEVSNDTLYYDKFLDLTDFINQ